MAGYGILSEQECENVLASATSGHIACFSPAHDESYVVPVSFVYHPGGVYFASVPGKKLDYLREHPKGVCFEVDSAGEQGEHLTVLVNGDFEQLEPLPSPPDQAKPERGPLRTIFEQGLVPYSRESLVLCKLAIRSLSGRKDHWSWGVDFKVPGAIG